MAITPRSHLPYPDEQRDPWWQQFLDLVQAIDANVFAEWEDRNMLVMGGGLVSWNAITNTLTWATNIEFNAAPTGFLWRVLAGNLAVLDGEYVYFQAVRSPLNNVAVTFFTGSQVPTSTSHNPTDSVMLAYRRGTKIFFRNGAVLDHDEVGEIFDIGPGGLENFSYKTVIATKTLLIPQYQQMIVSGGMTVDGTVILNGEITLI